MARLYADLHPHPSLYSFNRMRNSAAEDDPERFHPWQPMPVDERKMAEGAHAAGYTQASFAKLTRSRARLAFASLTPIERGFLEFGEGEDRRPFTREALRLATGATAVKGGLEWIRRGRAGAEEEITRILRNRGPVRQALQVFYTHYSLSRVRYMLSDRYDYWDEYQRELAFLRGADGRRHHPSPGPAGPGTDEDVEGCYQLVRDAAQLSQIIESDSDEIAVVLTIEGAHTFALETDGRPIPLDGIVERIGQLRAQPEPVLVLTLAHHFDNGICGHAHSLPSAARLAMDQSLHMHEGFVREGDRGLTIVRELLDLDADLEGRGGHRILLDIKHMSPLTRREYYREVIEPHNARWEARSEAERGETQPLPVVATHVGYSGVPSLQQLVDDAHRETDHHFIGGFNAWGLNLCDEDVRMVHRSRGLIGLIFDRRVAGVAPGVQVPDHLWDQVLFRQILGFVDAVMLDDRVPRGDRRRIWDCLCFGTDFDGVTHPLPRYPTVLDYDRLADDLTRLLHGVKHTRMIEEIGVEELVEKICWRNAYEFAVRHLPG